jgi:hypothetical protein
MNSTEITEITAATFTVAFEDDNSAWAFFRDNEVPDGWTVWESGLSWAEACDAISS